MKKIITILFFISILLSQTFLIRSCVDFSSSITLVPPSLVSDKINLSRSVWNNEDQSKEEKKWISEPGKLKILVGNSSREIRLLGEFQLN